MYIDPVTGAIIDQTEHQTRALPSGDVVLDLNMAFTDATVRANVDAANGNISQLHLIGNLPWISYLLALVALVVGLLLLRGTGRDSTKRDEAEIDALIDRRMPRTA